MAQTSQTTGALMAFPASNGATFPLTLDTAWIKARDTAAAVKSQTDFLNGQITAGPVSAQNVVTTASVLANANVVLTSCAAVPGIAAFAQQQVNNASLDVAGAFTAMQNALVAVVTWIVTNFPKDGSSNLLAIQFNGSGQLVWSTFTQAQLSGLATLLTALSATIS